MKKLNSRETLILIITLALLLFFMAFQFVVKPMQEGGMDINDQLRQKRAQLDKAQRMMAQKPQIEAMYQSLVNSFGAAGSEEAQMPAIVTKIEAAARQSNVHITNMQPQKPITQKELMFLPVELEIDGQWLDIVSFLGLLQKGADFYFIDEFNLEKYSDAADSLRGRVVISRVCLINKQ